METSRTAVANRYDGGIRIVVGLFGQLLDLEELAKCSIQWANSSGLDQRPAQSRPGLPAFSSLQAGSDLTDSTR